MAKREPVVDGGKDNKRKRPSGDRVASVATWLWSRYTSVSTAGTSEEALYLDDLEANTLETNGDIFKFEYTGTFAANANDKYIRLFIASNEVIDTDVLNVNNRAWTLLGTMTRESNTVIRVSGFFSTFGVTAIPFYTRLTGLSGLATNEYSVELRAETPDNAGDVTVTLCNAYVIPVIT